MFELAWLGTKIIGSMLLIGAMAATVVIMWRAILGLIMIAVLVGVVWLGVASHDNAPLLTKYQPDAISAQIKQDAGTFDEIMARPESDPLRQKLVEHVHATYGVKI